MYSLYNRFIALGLASWGNLFCLTNTMLYFLFFNAFGKVMHFSSLLLFPTILYCFIPGSFAHSCIPWTLEGIWGFQFRSSSFLNLDCLINILLTDVPASDVKPSGPSLVPVAPLAKLDKSFSLWARLQGFSSPTCNIHSLAPSTLAFTVLPD